MEFNRARYLNQVIKKQHNGLIKVVTGIRRCGKSYLLFTLYKDYLLKSGVPADHIFEMRSMALKIKSTATPKYSIHI